MGKVVRSDLIAQRIQDGEDRRMEGALDTKVDIYADAISIVVIVRREAGEHHCPSLRKISSPRQSRLYSCQAGVMYG